MTYFDLGHLNRIPKLKKEGIQFAQELKDATGEIADGIIETPRGQHIFVFSQ